MGEPISSYDMRRLSQSSEDLGEALDTLRSQLQAVQSRADDLGAWWNPDNDPNDLIGGLLGGLVTEGKKLMMSTGHQNVDVGQRQRQAMQAFHEKMRHTEANNTRESNNAWKEV